MAGKRRTGRSGSGLGMVAALTVPLTAGAVGLGDIQIHSQLNEPFRASIPVSTMPGQSLAGAQIELGSREAYERLDVVRLPYINHLQARLVDEGQPRILLESSRPLREPFVSLVVEFDWSGGRMLKEYSVLFDPIGPNTAPLAPRTFEPVLAARSGGASISENNPSRSYGPVSRNDTLWRIANAIHPDSRLSVNQTMLALLQANPDAFEAPNVNRLRAGAVLEIPSRDAIASINANFAHSQVRQQNRIWRDDQRTGAEPVSEMDGSASDAAPAGLTLEPPEALDWLAEAPSEQAGQTLSVEGQSGAAGAELARDPERLASQVQRLEERLDHLESLINLRLQELAVLQAPAAGEDPFTEEGAIGDAVPESAAAPSEEVLDEAPQLAEPDEATESPSAADQSPDSPAETQPVAEPEPVQSAPAPAQAVEADAKQLFGLDRDLLVRGGLGGALVVLLLAWLAQRRKNQPTQDDAPAPVAKRGRKHLTGAELFGDGEASEGQSQEAVETSDEEAPEEEDPLREAERLQQEGQLDEARRLLEDTIPRQPFQPVPVMMLLRVLSDLNDVDAYARTAERHRALIEESGFGQWDEVTRMGRALEPGNPLYDDTLSQNIGEEAFFDEINLSGPVDEPVAGQPDDGRQVPDVSLDDPSEPGSEEVSSLLGDTFDLEEIVPAASETATAETSESVQSADDWLTETAQSGEAAEQAPLEPDFSFELDSPGQDADAATDVSLAKEGGDTDNAEIAGDFEGDFASIETPAEADESLTFVAEAEEGSDSVADLHAGEDAAATKLDLATAYLDMRDEDSARELLQEVLTEGTPEQIREAEELLARLAGGGSESALG